LARLRPEDVDHPLRRHRSGRPAPSISEIGWARIVGGLAIWIALLVTHQVIVGASPLPIF
jgi:hypothetical protein